MPARRILLVLCLVASTLALAPLGAGATNASTFVTKEVGDPQAAVAAWTPERMAAAEPAAPPAIHPEDLNAPLPARGEPVFVPGSGASTERYSSSSAGGSSEGPIPFERFRIEDPSVAPYAAHGVLFGNDNGVDFGCSGTAINSDNKSVVWTAAHCLYSGGKFVTDVVFVPGYEEQRVPYGIWAADQLAVPTQWKESQDSRYDFAGFRTLPNESGSLGDVIALRGIAFNQQPTELFQSFGYPAVPSDRFDGEHLETCRSHGSGRLWSGMIAMGCDMEFGSSGGGWVIRDEFVASNVSGGNTKVWPNVAFGPYLGSAARALYDGLRGGTSPIPEPTPTAPPTTPVKHPMKVTLVLRRHVVATGRLTPVDGYTACARTAPIQLGKKRSDGTFYPVGKLLFTDAEGRFRTRLRDRAGRYVAFAEASPYDNSNRCGEAVTFARHRH
ncbi:MAG: hypothetical protein M3N53_13710 [Actinomycetota bacterium]|nr:hypothetical protein [Actinomycetota bacterium]